MILAAALVIACIAIAPVLAGNNGNGNGAPSGPHYNLNIIGVPEKGNGNYDPQGSVIFVSRTGSTFFYVHGGTSYEVLDHNGVDGKVGSSITSPGIIFPYDTESGTWLVKIYVRLLGPKDSSVDWTTYVPSFLQGKTSITDSNGQVWYEYATFSLNKDTKFQLKTGQLLPDGYQDVLWELDPVNNFRICQLRIYLVDA